VAQAFIGLGSNLGDGRKNLLLAWRHLQRQAGCGLALSSPYLTEPVGMDNDYLFTNAVGLLQTLLSPEDLLAVMLQVEEELGRDRQKGRDRTIDLDLLYYDDLVLATSSLNLPHPEIAKRRFVLAPLAELAPLHVHPILHQTSLEMMENLTEEGGWIKRTNWESQ
jgi:2-amino-4-hydroxy-6-hydroxymethyldihydropteridine diphosphokinase